MNGLELSRAYFESFGKPMLDELFPELWAVLAIGFVGSGSDRFGFDDKTSRDHDFEPGFCLFLPGEDVVDRHTAFRLERAYSKLPKEFGGAERQRMSPVGGNRNGVIRTADFYQNAIGDPKGELSVQQWLTIPDYALAEAVNGEVFYDGLGEFSEIRSRLKSMPEDVRKKRIAGNILLMAQSGQYNFSRCLSHGEPEAAQLACNEFVTACMKVHFLLNGRYMPYYKWSFRALRQFNPQLAEKLSILLKGDNCFSANASLKNQIIEEISADIISIIKDSGLSNSDSPDLERHAYAVNDAIADGDIRNLHILSAV